MNHRTPFGFLALALFFCVAAKAQARPRVQSSEQVESGSRPPGNLVPDEQLPTTALTTSALPLVYIYGGPGSLDGKFEDANGQTVDLDFVFHHDSEPANDYSSDNDATVGSGVYFVRVQRGAYHAVTKVALVE